MFRTLYRYGLLIAWSSLAAGVVLSQGAKRDLGEKYALLVGVRQYDRNELRTLAYSENDVMQLAEVLRKAGYQRVVLMTQTEGAREARFLPLSGTIRKTLKGLLEDRTEADSILVALAGHGVQFRGSEESYFCPMDARLGDKKTLISLSEVYRELEKCPAAVKVLLVDACRNDPQSDNSRARAEVDLESVTRPQKVEPPGGVAALFSCSAGQKAFESSELKHGIFFHYVIEGLKGKADLDRDGRVDLDELIRYAKKRVPDHVKEEYGDEVHQVPAVKGEIKGLPELVRLDRVKDPDIGDTKTGEITNSIGMKLVLIPAGKFKMGSPANEKGRYDDEQQHDVEITHPFYMGIHAVTRGQFGAFVKDEDYKTDAEKDGQGGWGYDAVSKTFKGPNYNSKTGQQEGSETNYSWSYQGHPQTDRHPVVNVSWMDAGAFCKWLSRKESKQYRLPTEAEWEYSCRAGTTTRFWSGDDDESLKGTANIADASFKAKYPKAGGAESWDDGYAFSAPVGRFKRNGFGLYDMHGNVWQWCADWYDKDYYKNSPQEDPEGPGAGTFRVYRGGSFNSVARNCRAADRERIVPAYRSHVLGFRVVRVQ